MTGLPPETLQLTHSQDQEPDCLGLRWQRGGVGRCPLRGQLVTVRECLLGFKTFAKGRRSSSHWPGASAAASLCVARVCVCSAGVRAGTWVCVWVHVGMHRCTQLTVQVTAQGAFVPCSHSSPAPCTPFVAWLLLGGHEAESSRLSETCLSWARSGTPGPDTPPAPLGSVRLVLLRLLLRTAGSR